MTAARRLAAILAVDVAGYSRLMGEDDAGTTRAVGEHREAARPIAFNASDRFTSTPAVGSALNSAHFQTAAPCQGLRRGLRTSRARSCLRPVDADEMTPLALMNRPRGSSPRHCARAGAD